MEKVMLTEKEEMVLREIIKMSNFNFCHLDLSKTWDDQILEGDSYDAFADIEDYGCGLSKPACRGVFGSLAKKGLIKIRNDRRNDWIVIEEKEFNRIKAVFN